MHLRGKLCRTMKVHLHNSGDDWYHDPDVMMDCDPAGQHKYYRETPAIIFEVLRRIRKAATAGKSGWLRKVPIATHLGTGGAGSPGGAGAAADFRGWTRELLPDAGDAVRLPEIGCEIPLDAIYSRTGF